MKWPQLKDIVSKEFAVKAMGVLCLVVQIIDKVQKEPQSMKMYKLRTKHHHVRVFSDVSFTPPCIIVKKKGFLKEWQLIDKKDMPQCLSDGIFEASSSKEERKQLIDKMMKLKAFW